MSNVSDPFSLGKGALPAGRKTKLRTVSTLPRSLPRMRNDAGDKNAARGIQPLWRRLHKMSCMIARERKSRNPVILDDPSTAKKPLGHISSLIEACKTSCLLNESILIVLPLMEPINITRLYFINARHKR